MNTTMMDLHVFSDHIIVAPVGANNEHLQNCYNIAMSDIDRRKTALWEGSYDGTDSVDDLFGLRVGDELHVYKIFAIHGSDRRESHWLPADDFPTKGGSHRSVIEFGKHLGTISWNEFLDQTGLPEGTPKIGCRRFRTKQR